MSAFPPIATKLRDIAGGPFRAINRHGAKIWESSFFRGGYPTRDFGVQGACLVAAESNLEYRLKALADLFWVILRFPEPTLTAVA